MTTATWAQSDYKAVMELLGARTGLSFAAGPQENAVLGIRRAMARAEMRELARYYDLIETDAEALDDLIIELTIGFFREPAQFEFIRRELLPGDLEAMHEVTR